MRRDRPAQGRSFPEDAHGLILRLTACEQPEKQCEPENTMSGAVVRLLMVEDNPPVLAFA